MLAGGEGHLKELEAILDDYKAGRINTKQAEIELRLREWSAKEAERVRIEKWLNAERNGD